MAAEARPPATRDEGYEAVVLVVEDDPQVRDLIRDALEEEGFRVETAGDGAEALDWSDTNRPAAVVLDLLLPDMDGDTVAAWLRTAHGNSLPIVLISGNHPALDRASRSEGLPEVRKPFDIEELIGVVRKALRES